MVRLPLTPDELERGRRLGTLLRQARGDRPMLDTALAAGISPETLRKIETGRVATPAFSTIAAIAGILDLSLDRVWAEIQQAEIQQAEIQSGQSTPTAAVGVDRLAS